MELRVRFALIICDSLQRSSISFNIENLSLIRDMSLFLSTSVWKYWLKLPSRNNLYTKPDKINITPARNKDAIVIRCITQYRRSCKISINGRSPVEIYAYLQGCGRTSSLAWRVYTRNIRDYVVVPHYSRARHVHRGHGPLAFLSSAFGLRGKRLTPILDSTSPLGELKSER